MATEIKIRLFDQTHYKPNATQPSVWLVLIKNDRRDRFSLGGVPFKVYCVIEIEKWDWFWYNRVQTAGIYGEKRI